MRSTLSLAVIALGATAATAPAFAQYGTHSSTIQNNSQSAPAGQPVTPGVTGPQPLCQAGISKQARPALVALQTAVVAKNLSLIHI